jgi:hypothetical protein
MSTRIGNYILFGLLAVVPIDKCTRGEYSPDWSGIGFTLLTIYGMILYYGVILILVGMGLAILKWLIRD